MDHTPTPPDDLVVRLRLVDAWDDPTDTAKLAHRAANEIERLRAALAWLVETEAVMWTSDAVYQHGYGSTTIPAPDDIIAVLREVDR